MLPEKIIEKNLANSIIQRKKEYDIYILDESTINSLSRIVMLSFLSYFGI